MPTFFPFEEGNPSKFKDKSVLRLGRFKEDRDDDDDGWNGGGSGTGASDMDPLRPKHKSSYNSLFASWSTTSLGYGAIPPADAGDGNGDDDDDDDIAVADEGDDVAVIQPRRRKCGLLCCGFPWRYLLTPTHGAVEKLVDTWWSRLMLFVLIPAGVVVSWCAIPLPTTPIVANPPPSFYETLNKVIEFVLCFFARIFPWGNNCSTDSAFLFGEPDKTTPQPPPPDGAVPGPGHGSALVDINFWFWLVVYYGFYTLIGLLYMTELFNLYSLNWWPQKLGGLATYFLSWTVSILIGLPIYYFLPSFATWNMTWILLTFVTMCIPALLAFGVLHAEDRHSTLRYHLPNASDHALEAPDADSEDFLSTYGRIFSSWTSTLSRARSLSSSSHDVGRPTWRRQISRRVRRRTMMIPQSYVRFLWFCTAIAVSLLAFVVGELYAEVYLRTLPHSRRDTVVYVYSWVLTIFALDGLTGWILGAKVRSYPLTFVFKLYFSLTYQTYVRALYARLRSPKDYVVLQLISSSFVLIIQPIMMTETYHRFLSWINMNGQTYYEYQKFTGRSFFLRGIAENVSMAAFIGWIVVVHYGPNNKVYPYLSFRDGDTKNLGYTFSLTFWASSATWCCEIIAGWGVRRVMKYAFEFGVTGEGKQDLIDYPQLVPTCLIVMIHVLQNMLFSMIRLKFIY